MTKANILIVENDGHLKTEVKAALEAEGYAVAVAEKGEKALEGLSARPVDVLLTDYKLPDMNGLDLISQFLQVSKETIPIIVSENNSLEIAFEGMRRGTLDYLVKPVNAEELKRTIAGLLAERDELREGKARFQGVVQKLKYSDEKAVETIVERVEPENKPEETKLTIPQRIRAMFRNRWAAIRKYFWDIK